MGFMGRRRGIAARNLALCFPEWDDAKRETVLRGHFAALGMGIFELGLAWWAADERLRRVCRVTGLEHLDAALARGRGVLLLSGHFSTLELAMRLLILFRPIHGVYRPHGNPVMDFHMTRRRAHHAEQAIPRDDVRGMAKCLRANQALWFAPDQNFGHKGSVFVDFFGVTAATNTATARLAKMTGAAVVPFACRRLPECAGYELSLSPALAEFPDADVVAATQRVNQALEDAVRAAPEQYFWIHRRFKDRPPGEAEFY